MTVQDVNDARVRRCVQDLADDYYRQGGHLAIDDVLRLTSRRGLSQDEVSAVWRALRDDEGIEVRSPSESVAPLADVLDAEGLRSDDAVTFFFRELGRWPVPSPNEQFALARRVQAGTRAQRAVSALIETPEDVERIISEGRSARREMIARNLRLVVNIAKRYYSAKLDLLDLIQEGAVALNHAIDKFEPDYGYQFSTYATYWIRQAIQRALDNFDRTIRVPVHMLEAIRKMRKVRARLEVELMTTRPPIVRLAAELNIPPEEVMFLYALEQDVLSLDLPIGEDGDSTLADLVVGEAPDPLDRVVRSALREALNALLDELGPRERQMIEMRHGLKDGQPRTLEEVGRAFGVTRERIRQVETRALARLRHPTKIRRLEDLIK